MTTSIKTQRIKVTPFFIYKEFFGLHTFVAGCLFTKFLSFQKKVGGTDPTFALVEGHFSWENICDAISVTIAKIYKRSFFAFNRKIFVFHLGGGNRSNPGNAGRIRPSY